MPFMLKFFLPAFTGGLLALLVMFGLVWSQTQPPSSNPASNPVISYGAR